MAAASTRNPLSFDDVAVVFSGEEWDMLSSHQRALYMEVMKENYDHFITLGFKVPIILSWQQNGNKEAAAPKTSPVSSEPAAPPANHVKEKRSREAETEPPLDPITTSGGGRRTSKRARVSQDENVQIPDSSSQDENQTDAMSPPHGRNLRKRKQYYCSQCEKCFNYSSALEAHMRVHSGDKPHKCEICEETFGYKSELIVHRRTHMNSYADESRDSENISPAPLAERPQDTVASNSVSPKAAAEEPRGNKTIPQMFNQTANTSVNGTSKPTNSSTSSPQERDGLRASPSPSSSSSTPSSSSAYLPQKESDKPLKCNYCEKRFNDRSILEAHHRIHTGKQAYACGLCDESFSKPSLLAAHNNTHREGKPFQCDQCDKNFNDQALLVAHKRTHTGEKPHKCSHCNKWFPNRSTLVEHEDSHLKPKPYKCRHCDKSFNDKALLLTHEGVHTDTKPFKCTQCNESFFLKTQLVTHQSTHAPEKPHPCNQCDRSFNKRETLLAHIRVHNMQSAQMQKNFKK